MKRSISHFIRPGLWYPSLAIGPLLKRMALSLMLLWNGPLRAQEAVSGDTKPPTDLTELQWLNLQDSSLGVPVAAYNLAVWPDTTTEAKPVGHLAIGEWVTITQVQGRVAQPGNTGVKWAKIRARQEEQTVEGWVLTQDLGTRENMSLNVNWELESMRSYFSPWEDPLMVEYLSVEHQPGTYRAVESEYKQLPGAREGHCFRYKSVMLLAPEPGEAELVFFYPKGTRNTVGMHNILKFQHQLYPVFKHADRKRYSYSDFTKLFAPLKVDSSFFIDCPKDDINLPADLREGYYIPLGFKNWFPDLEYGEDKFNEEDYFALLKEMDEYGLWGDGLGIKAHNRIQLNRSYTGFIVSTRVNTGFMGEMKYLLWVWNIPQQEMVAAIHLSGFQIYRSGNTLKDYLTAAWLEDLDQDGSLDLVQITKRRFYLPNAKKKKKKKKDKQEGQTEYGSEMKIWHFRNNLIEPGTSLPMGREEDFEFDATFNDY